jgi:hypothetical protein
MRTLRVDFSPTGMDFSLRGVALASGVPYNSAGSRLCEIAFRGESNFSSAFFDNFLFTAQSGFQAWQESHWPGVTDPAVIGETANPAGDGIPNFLRYALGIDPLKFTRPATTFRIDNSGRPTLDFSRWSGATDVTYSVEASTDLMQWDNIWSSRNDLFGGTGSTYQQSVTDQFPVQDLPAGRRFLRLRVSKP